MGAATGFHADEARWQIGKKRQHAVALERFTDNPLAVVIDGMYLYHIRGDIQTNGGDSGQKISLLGATLALGAGVGSPFSPPNQLRDGFRAHLDSSGRRLHQRDERQQVQQPGQVTIVSPFFAKPEMDPSDFRSKKWATLFACGCPR